MNVGFVCVRCPIYWYLVLVTCTKKKRSNLAWFVRLTSNNSLELSIFEHFFFGQTTKPGNLSPAPSNANAAAPPRGRHSFHFSCSCAMLHR